jgi:uncharacterized protein (TIGR03790 family)
VLCFPAWALDHRELALVVNTLDPLSVEIGKYYARKRKIDFQNVVRVAFEPKASLSKEEFEVIKQQVDEQVRPHVQAFALAWAAPWRVECMSITSAFAFGFDPASCAWGCKPTPFSRYFASATRAPHADLGIRPAMALAAASLEEAKALIDRGVAADGTHPEGTAYLLTTSDAARSVRSPGYPLARRVAKGTIPVKILQQDTLTYRTDVLFYFTGAARVAGLKTLRFLPGAIADHLTSSGGVLDAGGGGQMSALEWLEAGATASYGTVAEPCNLPQKFPHPAVAIAHYLAGETLIEAYWKSVRMPGQGVFVGEPLAAPFRPL